MMVDFNVIVYCRYTFSKQWEIHRNIKFINLIIIHNIEIDIDADIDGFTEEK